LLIIQRTMQEMNKYSNGKIYKIVSPNHKKVYYGSTIQILEYRFDIHKTHRTYSSRHIIDAGDAEILEIEPFPCTCKEELEDREAEYILNDWEGCVNETVPGAVRRAGGIHAYNRTPERKAKSRAYDKTAHGKAKRKAYEQSQAGKARMKAYQQKPHYQAYLNSAKRKAHRAEKIPCSVCGKCVSRQNISTHQKGKKCQNHLKTELGKVMDGIITSIELIHG